MKAWYWWLVLSGIWVLAAILNFLGERNPMVVGYDVFAALIFAGLAFVQRLCER